VATLVDIGWVAERLHQPGMLILDSRLYMRYLMGHLPGAVNVPAPYVFGPDGLLLPPAGLAAWLGRAGLSDDVTPVVYDSHDGQRGALLIWVLEYLGRRDVHLMDAFYDAWRVAGHPIVYPRHAVAACRLHGPAQPRRARGDPGRAPGR